MPPLDYIPSIVQNVVVVRVINLNKKYFRLWPIYNYSLRIILSHIPAKVLLYDNGSDDAFQR